MKKGEETKYAWIWTLQPLHRKESIFNEIPCRIMLRTPWNLLSVFKFHRFPEEKKKINKSLPCTGVGEYLVFDLKLVSQKCYPLFKITFRGSEFQNLRINYFFAIIIPVEEHTNEWSVQKDSCKIWAQMLKSDYCNVNGDRCHFVYFLW